MAELEICEFLLTQYAPAIQGCKVQKRNNVRKQEVDDLQNWIR